MIGLISLLKNISKKVVAFLVIKIDILYCFNEYFFFRHKFKYFNFISGGNLKDISNENISIFHIYTNYLGKDNKDYLDFLSDNNFHIIISSALRLDRKSIEFLENSKLNYSLFYKQNVGRDFHSYKHFYEELTRLKIKYENLLFCNDSLFFIKELSNSLKKNMDIFFKSPTKTVASLTINYVSHAHLGSFFILVKNNRSNAKKLTKYFKNYIPLSNRVWSIKQGECGLSDALRYPHSYHLSIFYAPSCLLEINDMKKISYATSLLTFLFNIKEKSNSNVEYLSLTNEQNSKNTSSTESKKIKRKLKEKKLLMANYYNVIGQIVLENFNPTHTFALNYCLAGFPFLKKDIVKVYTKFSSSHIITTLRLCNLEEESIKYFMEGLSSSNFRISYRSRSFMNKIKNEVFL